MMVDPSVAQTGRRIRPLRGDPLDTALRFFEPSQGLLEIGSLPKPLVQVVNSQLPVRHSPDPLSYGVAPAADSGGGATLKAYSRLSTILQKLFDTT